MRDLEALRDAAFASLQKTVGATAGSDRANEDGKRANAEILELLRKQDRVISQVIAEPKPRAVVLAIAPNEEATTDEMLVAVVSYQGMQIETRVPKDMGLRVGDEVSLLNSTLQPIALIREPICIGDIAIVSRVVSEAQSEVLFRGAKRLVLNGLWAKKLEAGDRVVVDNSCMIITSTLGKSGNEFEFLGEGVTWDRIIGCSAAKAKLRATIETPYLRPDIFAHYKNDPPKGILLIGVPGCGKTLLLRACVHAHREMHKENALVLFVNAGELLRGIVGETEEVIRQLFEISRAHRRRTKKRALLVIDEAEAIFPKRGSGKSSDVEKTNVPTFLGEMSGFRSDDNPVVLLASNKPETMDEALMRDERMDEVIVVAPPTQEDAPAFFSLYLDGVPIEGTLDEMARYAAEEFFSPRYALATVKRRSTEVIEAFTLGHIVNGAMLAGVARRAKAIAGERDLLTTKLGDPLGKITKEDLCAGIQDALEKNRHLDNREAFLRFVRGFSDDIAEGDKVLRTVFGG